MHNTCAVSSWWAVPAGIHSPRSKYRVLSDSSAIGSSRPIAIWWAQCRWGLLSPEAPRNTPMPAVMAADPSQGCDNNWLWCILSSPQGLSWINYFALISYIKSLRKSQPKFIYTLACTFSRIILMDQQTWIFETHSNSITLEKVHASV